jgi:hypothetical protein
VLRGVFRGESLFRGEIGLLEIAMANEALDVLEENKHRWEDANRPD